MGGFLRMARAMLTRWRCPPETAAPVADHGVVALFGLHDEVMSVGDFGCGDDLVHGGVLHSEGDIVVECVVEEDGFLVDVADERA